MRKVWKTIEGLTRPCNRKLPFLELRRGDIIEVDEGRGVITGIDDYGIAVLSESGRTGRLDPQKQFVIRQSPDHIQSWVFDALSRGAPISVYLIQNRCPQCGFAGWAATLTAGMYLITHAEDVFYYPGIRRQLREFFMAHPEVKAKFGTVKWRYWKPAHRRMLLQLCPECNALWEASPLVNALHRYVDEREGSVEPDRVRHAFDVEIGGLFDEGTAPRPDALKEARRR